jgi:uncharacterized protein (DUF58 family)
MKELKVDILPLISKLEAVLKKGFSREIMAGSYQSVFKGKGMEFVGFREYTQADDALLIDWKASLRSHKPMVRVLEEERDLTVFFLLDVSETMLFSSHGKLKCEFAAELVATLAYAMSQVGDNIGLAMFTDKIVKVIPPALGKNQFYRVARTLTDPSFYGGPYDLAKALNFLLSFHFLQRDAIVFIISDFIGLKEGWEQAIKIAGLKFDMTAFIVRDPIDMRLPTVSGEVYLKDPFSINRVMINPTSAAQVYENTAKKQIEQLEEQLKKTNSSKMILETDKDFTQEIFTFFRMRQRFK